MNQGDRVGAGPCLGSRRKEGVDKDTGSGWWGLQGDKGRLRAGLAAVPKQDLWSVHLGSRGAVLARQGKEAGV